MLLVSHVAIGALIAENSNIFWGSLVAFLSHFVLDMLPHVQAPTDKGYIPNKKTYFFVIIDIILVVLFINLVGISFYEIDKIIIILAAVIPDILDLTRYNIWFKRTFKSYYDFHDKIQVETNKPIGFISQLIIIIGCFYGIT